MSLPPTQPEFSRGGGWRHMLLQHLLHFIGLMFVIPEPSDWYEIMQEHVEQREDGEVKRPRFHLKFAYRLKVSAVFNLCVCWSFPPLQPVASLLQVLLKWVPWWRRFSPSVPRAFTSRGSRFLLRRYTVVLWTCFLAGSGHNSMRWQRCLMEEAGDRLWKVRYVCRTSFSVKSWPKLDFWVFFGGWGKDVLMYCLVVPNVLVTS